LKQPAYAAAIQPVFDKYCVSCHGEKKSKGKLRMDTMKNFLKGGDSGSCIEPANSKESLLGKRIALPLEDDDHMPPDGKPQLSESQLAMLRWWLDAGAPTDKTLGELKPTTEILTAIQSAIAPVSASTKAR